jgi:hypothetical protein
LDEKQVNEKSCTWSSELLGHLFSRILCLT